MLVTDLLQLARADARPLVGGVSDLARLTADRVDTWSALAETNGITLHHEARGGLFVSAVPGAIEQILDNVLDNAVVAVTSAAGTHRLTITDAGLGLTTSKRRTPRGAAGAATRLLPARASDGTVKLADAPGGGLALAVTLHAASDPDTRPTPHQNRRPDVAADLRATRDL